MPKEQFRDWQNAFLLNWGQANQTNYLVEACPGAGKTIAAIQAMVDLRSSITRYFVVVPSDALRKQWVNELKRRGNLEAIALPNDTIDPWRRDSDGGLYDCAVITYQALTKWVPEVQLMTKRHRVMVVFDEIHHASQGEDSNQWGKAIGEAFGVNNPNVARRLSLSGTPFRADGQRIAFINYDLNGNAIPDTRYAYPDALKDRVVRPVLFPAQMGRTEWFDGRQEMQATFEDNLNQRHSSQRFRTAIDSKSHMVREMITSAWKQLQHDRQLQPNAGMIVFANDQEHARRLSKVVVNVTNGILPDVVISDTPNADKVIDDFRKGSQPIIICVGMIAEGVDIPRLRVAVYLSTRRFSRSWLWQCVGRIIRTNGNDDDGSLLSHCFIPGDKELTDWVAGVEKQVTEVLEERDKVERAQAERIMQEPLFYPISATGDHTVVIAIGSSHSVPLDKYNAYKKLAEQASKMLPGDKTVFEWLQYFAIGDGVDREVAKQLPDPSVQDDTPHSIVVKQTRSRVYRLTQQYGGILTNLHNEKQFSRAAALINATDGKKLADCTLEEMLKREETLRHWMRLNGSLHRKREQYD